MTKNDHLKPREKPVQPGEQAPDFTLLDQDRNEWRLSDALKQGDVVLSFYPMDFSPVCSTEMECLTKELQKFEKEGCRVAAISGDSFFTHKAWADQMGLKHTLLSDMHREVCKAYGFYNEDLNVPARGTVIISGGPDGKGSVKWVQAREIKDALKAEDLLAVVAS